MGRGAVPHVVLNPMVGQKPLGQDPTPEQAWRAKGARHDSMPRVTATTCYEGKVTRSTQDLSNSFAP